MKPVAENNETYDYSYVNTTACIALYDDMKSAPRITRIEPGETTEYIEKLASITFEQSKLLGGKVPYTAIREVSENFIHARFQEIVVSILDDGNTIRFADQGPGISDKEKAQEPGFTSAIQPMKRYIRGVGSGLPIVREFLDDRNGSIEIEDNLNSGAVVTISLVDKPSPTPPTTQLTSFEPAPVVLPRFHLSEREQLFLKLLLQEGDLGVTEMMSLAETKNSSTYTTFQKLEQQGLVDKFPNKKRSLTEIGRQVAQTL